MLSLNRPEDAESNHSSLESSKMSGDDSFEHLNTNAKKEETESSDSAQLEPPQFDEETFELPDGKVPKIEKIIDFNFRLQNYPEDKKKIVLEAREKA